jgi:transcriptional regulator with XRE-family HTH domain
VKSIKFTREYKRIDKEEIIGTLFQRFYWKAKPERSFLAQSAPGAFRVYVLNSARLAARTLLLRPEPTSPPEHEGRTHRPDPIKELASRLGVSSKTVSRRLKAEQSAAPREEALLKVARDLEEKQKWIEYKQTLKKRGVKPGTADRIVTRLKTAGTSPEAAMRELFPEVR